MHRNRIGKCVGKIGKIGIILMILVVSMFIHEEGHLLAFRSNNIEVESVSVGFPVWEIKLIIYEDALGTKYEVTPLLLGGYTLPKDEQSLENLPLSQKIISYSAGVMANFIIGFLLLILFIWLKWLRKTDLVRFQKTLLTTKWISSLNLMFGFYNLLVVFPVYDGGRILQLFLNPWLNDKATWFGFGGGILMYYVYFLSINPFLEKVYKL